MARDTDIREFAMRVERMCHFFLGKVKEEGGVPSKDIAAIEDLQEEASDIQLTWSDFSIEGLDDYMRGLTQPPPKAEEARES